MQKARRAAQPGPTSGADALELREARGSVTLRVRVQPRAAREELAGEHQGALRVRLTAPPVEGAANAALLRLLARTLGLPPSALALERGATGRDKLVRVAGLTAQQLRAALASGSTAARTAPPRRPSTA